MAVISDGSKRFQVDFVASGATNGFEIWDQWGEVLEAAGWTPIEYSDGSSVTVSGTRATTGQMDNNNAWQRMEAPSGTMEMVWQRGTTERSWRAFFCQSGYNNDGAPTVIPSEIDTEVQLVGTSGNFDSSWTGSNTTDFRWNMCADSVAGQTDLFYFHMFSHVIANGNEQDRFLFSPLETGTFPVENTAPWILVHGTTGGTINASTSCTGHFKRGLTGDVVSTAVTARQQAGIFPSGGVTNPWNGGQDFTRCRFGDTSGADEGYWGDPLDLFWPAAPAGILPERSTVNLATAWGSVAEGDPGAVYRYGDMLVPWPSTLVPTP